MARRAKLTEREYRALELVAAGKPTEVYEGYDSALGCRFSARADLAAIRAAWDRGCDFEAEADGYDPGMGTMGDWSGLRDSSDEAIERMLQKAVRFLYERVGTARRKAVR